MVDAQRNDRPSEGPAVPAGTEGAEGAGKRVGLRYEVEECQLLARTGRAGDCEDAIYLGPHFVAVIDGATSKSERRWHGKTGGRIAAEIIADAFDRVPAEATARQAVDLLTEAISDLYRQHDMQESVQADPVQRAIAAFVAISLRRREIWLVGDCQCLLERELLTCPKEVDSIIASARSLYLEAEIAQGRTIAELRERDTGREFVLPLIRRQMLFQNRPDRGQYWYAAIDGFAVPGEGIKVQPVPAGVSTIVLASDGYPVLRGTLAESERELEQVLQEDPLLFRRYRSVKGLARDNVSFDDRAYVRLRVWEERASV